MLLQQQHQKYNLYSHKLQKTTSAPICTYKATRNLPSCVLWALSTDRSLSQRRWVSIKSGHGDCGWPEVTVHSALRHLSQTIWDGWGPWMGSKLWDASVCLNQSFSIPPVHDNQAVNEIHSHLSTGMAAERLCLQAARVTQEWLFQNHKFWMRVG